MISHLWLNRSLRHASYDPGFQMLAIAAVCMHKCDVFIRQTFVDLSLGGGFNPLSIQGWKQT